MGVVCLTQIKVQKPTERQKLICDTLGGILVIFWFWGVFWSFFGFLGVVGNFVGFVIILVIFWFWGYLGHF